MNKIICDVCGTSYPNTAEYCPICGYSNENKSADEYVYSPEKTGAKAGKYSSSKKQKTVTKPAADDSAYMDDEFEDYGYEDSAPSPQQDTHRTAGIAVIISLVVLITLLLIGILFLFLRYYLPNRSDDGKSAGTTPTSAAVQPTDVMQTTEPRIPCTSLVMTSGVSELTRPGQYWLLHATVSPEDTTDPLLYTSADESIVTVTKHGRVTAVGEGETDVFIHCGDKQIKCHVVVRFEEMEEQTEPVHGTGPDIVDHEQLPEGVTAEPQKKPDSIDEETEPEETKPEETKPEETEPKETEPEETEQVTEPPSDTSKLKDVVLKLKDSDRSSNVKGVTFTLEL